jgi:hypothetical protein
VKRATRLAAPLALAVACTVPVASPPDDPALSAPVNACPEHACSAYTQSGAAPQCNGGVCVVSAQLPGLVLVVSLSEDSYFAPGQSFAIPFEHLFDPSPTGGCVPDGCTHLPPYGIVHGAYLVAPQIAATLGWNVGNPGQNTALPVHVTYRPLWPPSGPAGSAVDAESLGLPLAPLAANVQIDQSGFSPPGPNAGPSIAFLADVQPALYERTVAPDPPFDQAFPPDVEQVTVAPNTVTDLDSLTFDTTKNGSTTPSIPTFDFSGVAPGWTAYMRDATTRRPVSVVKHFTSSKALGVRLPTNHHPAGGDALTNTELVIAPPPGLPIPLAHFTPVANVLDVEEPFPALPAPTSLSGTVTDLDGQTPVEADLVFEVLPNTTNGIYESGPPPKLIPSNFEYTGMAQARIDPTTGAASYSLKLPAGQYTVTVRPLDSHGVAVVQAFDVPPSLTPVTAPNLSAGTMQLVTGSAVVSDGRKLSGALVEAVPTACATGTSTACLPRPGQTITGDDGSFNLDLDPGGYVLRIEPPDGTHFPWVLRTLLVGPAPVNLAPATVVYAPVYAGLTLRDPFENPIVNAVVRVYQVPAKGAALEVGRAITDTTGHYDMYLSPSSQ